MNLYLNTLHHINVSNGREYPVTSINVDSSKALSVDDVVRRVHVAKLWTSLCRIAVF